VALRPPQQRLRFYDLRHTCASLMIKTGAHPNLVREGRGHAFDRDHDGPVEPHPHVAGSGRDDEAGRGLSGERGSVAGPAFL